MDTQLEENRNPQSKAVAWLGATGAVLLMVSAVIFVWSGWETFDNSLKFGIIALITAMCFGVGTYLSKALPVMGSIFNHLGLFLIPVVLLSINMEGFFEWRPFLIFEGVFCVVWFYAASRFIKSPVLLPASVASTTMIALGLAALDDTFLGNIPAVVYMIPVILGLSFSKTLTRSSLFLLFVIGVSPIITIFEPAMQTGRGVVNSFGLGQDIRWYYSLAVAITLLIATVLNARTRKSSKLLGLIPALVMPYALLTLVDRTFGLNDIYIVVPAILLVIQALIFILREDAFFKENFKEITEWFSVFNLIVQGYVAAAIGYVYIDFLTKNYSSEVAFFDVKPAIGLLLTLCVGVGSRLLSPNTMQDFFLGFLGMFGVGAFLDLTSIVETTHRETRMLIAVIVVSLVAILFKKNYLVAVITPLTLIGTYVALSGQANNVERLAMFVVFVGALVYGLNLVKKTRDDIFWLSSFAASMFLVCFATVSIPEILGESTPNIDLIKIGFIFIVGLALTEVFEYLNVGSSYLFRKESGVEHLSPARILLLISYGATWFVGFNNEHIPTLIFTFAVVSFGYLTSWKRKESLTIILVAPTFLLGIYSAGYAFNVEGIIPGVIIGLASLFFILAVYDNYATLGLALNGTLFSMFGINHSLDNPSAFGQTLFVLGLVIVAVGILKNITALIPVGVILATIGFWFTLIAEDIDSLLLYAAPVSLGLIALGMYSRKVFPGQDQSMSNTSSWAAYAFPIVLFEMAAMAESFKTGESINSLIGGGVALLAIAIGGWRKLSAPMVLGTFFLVIFIIREIFNVANAVPLWAWIGFGALVLIVTAVVLERSQMTASKAKDKLKVVISDNFE